MHIVKVRLEFLPRLVCILTKDRQRALVFAGGVHLEIDIVFLQQLMEIWQLSHNANRTEDGKGGNKNFIGNAGHHVAPTSRHLINRDGQLNASIFNA